MCSSSFAMSSTVGGRRCWDTDGSVSQKHAKKITVLATMKQRRQSRYANIYTMHKIKVAKSCSHNKQNVLSTDA